MWLLLVLVPVFIVSLIIFVSTLRHLKTTQPPSSLQAIPSSQLPTLSVCIPARNETVELKECLQSLIANNYPKLEILVLDDQSQTKRTPEIIRQFAHDGVVFLQGKQPPASWLAKNYAYDQLTDAANGEVLLFCGVDVRLEPDSLTNLVLALQQKRKAMISLLPLNISSQGLKSLLLQPARYAWELALPRRLINRPPVLSTCWLISRQALHAAGGFDAVKRKVVPEAYFARQAAGLSDGYSFMIANQSVGVSSRKSFADQRETAIRTRYPQLHRRPELVAVVSLAEVIVLLMPLLLCVWAVIASHWLLASFAGATYLLNAVVYGLMCRVAYRKQFLPGLIIFPLAVAYDIAILNISMWQYKFGHVMWKGRDITGPVMQASPDLVQKR